MKEAIELAEYLRDLGYMPEQVQDFYPTPSTVSTVMYYTGIDPRDGKKVYVCRNPHEKAMQRALIQYRNPNNYELVQEALIKGGREDLIGFDKKCLIRPRRLKTAAEGAGGRKKTKPAMTGGAKAELSAKRTGGSRSGAQNGPQNRPADTGKRRKKTIRNVHQKKK